MAKFCSYCGKPLPESGVCDCAESAAANAAVSAAPAQPAAPAAPAQPAAPAAENAYVKKTREAVSQSVPFVKDYWKDPMTATRHVLQQKNMGLAAVMMILNALVTGLLLFCVYSKLGSALRGASKQMFGGKVDVEVPFFSSMLMGILMAAVALALSAVVLFAILRMVRIDASFSYVIMAVGVNSILCTACLVLALLMALLGWTTGVLICVLLGMVAWVFLGTLLLVKVFGASISGAMQVITGLLFTAVLVLNVWIGGKFALNAAREIEIEGEELGDTIDTISDQMEDMSIEDFLMGF